MMILTEMRVALRSIALRGISNLSLTCIQKREYGRVSSRDTAHRVRDDVVTKFVNLIRKANTRSHHSLLATILAKKQKANMASSTDAADFEPVP